VSIRGSLGYLNKKIFPEIWSYWRMLWIRYQILRVSVNEDFPKWNSSSLQQGHPFQWQLFSRFYSCRLLGRLFVSSVPYKLELWILTGYMHACIHTHIHFMDPLDRQMTTECEISQSHNTFIQVQFILL
jgi:hypothetical protein